MDLIVFLVIGVIAGWIAGVLMKGGGFGLLGNIAVGVVGAIIGGHRLGWLGLVATGLIGSIVTAVIGAVVLLYVIRVVKKGS